jgi:hypothetical protein
MHKRSRRDDNPPLSGYIDVAGDPEREGEGGGLARGLGEEQQRLTGFHALWRRGTFAQRGMIHLDKVNKSTDRQNMVD